MKKLIVAVLACVVGMAAFAAQCEGHTKKGERCKREAAEGSKFCLGHADQATETKAKEKDDGTCWAITESGARCKHKKDGETDYCKQHAADVKPAKPQTQCRAMTWAGTRCSNKPEDGYLYCKQHRKQPAGSAASPKAKAKKSEKAK